MSGGPADRLYVVIGDSYSAGYQPAAGDRPGGTNTNGFAYQLRGRYAASGKPLRLVNFACSGVRSIGLLEDKGCPEGARAPGASGYSDVTQAHAVEQFLRTHRAEVALVTISIGGNDIKPCLIDDQGVPHPDPAPCGAQAVTALRSNLSRFLDGVRAAAGPDVRIIGLTYPDPFLGAWVWPVRGGADVAAASIPMFRDQLNPALRDLYARVGAQFVDITAASGAYQPFSVIAAATPYGPIPKSVARACQLTYYCELGDPHPTTEGYALIADEVHRALPSP